MNYGTVPSNKSVAFSSFNTGAEFAERLQVGCATVRYAGVDYLLRDVLILKQGALK